jgi:hypothetical protein
VSHSTDFVVSAFAESRNLSTVGRLLFLQARIEARFRHIGVNSRQRPRRNRSRTPDPGLRCVIKEDGAHARTAMHFRIHRLPLPVRTSPDPPFRHPFNRGIGRNAPELSPSGRTIAAQRRHVPGLCVPCLSGARTTRETARPRESASGRVRDKKGDNSCFRQDALGRPFSYAPP